MEKFLLRLALATTARLLSAACGSQFLDRSALSLMEKFPLRLALAITARLLSAACGSRMFMGYEVEPAALWGMRYV